jgi:very-short-patch-repair endonuclease
MESDIDLTPDGYRTLRFPAWLIRSDPEYVARRILEACAALATKAQHRRRPRPGAVI